MLHIKGQSAELILFSIIHISTLALNFPIPPPYYYFLYSEEHANIIALQ